MLPSSSPKSLNSSNNRCYSIISYNQIYCANIKSLFPYSSSNNDIINIFFKFIYNFLLLFVSHTINFTMKFHWLELIFIIR